MKNLMPGVRPLKLRYAIERVISEDLFGPDARQLLRSDERNPPVSLNAPLGLETTEDDDAPLPDRLKQDDPSYARFEAQRILRQLVDRADLTDGEHTALLYRELRGYSVEETAEEMDSTEGSVRALHSKAKSKLRAVAESAALV